MVMLVSWQEARGFQRYGESIRIKLPAAQAVKVRANAIYKDFQSPVFESLGIVIANLNGLGIKYSELQKTYPVAISTFSQIKHGTRWTGI